MKTSDGCCWDNKTVLEVSIQQSLYMGNILKSGDTDLLKSNLLLLLILPQSVFTKYQGPDACLPFLTAMVYLFLEWKPQIT